MSAPDVWRGVIFDVDGVLVDSPHERAWRDTLAELMGTAWRDLQPATSYTPERYTTAVYQELVAGKPRLDGAHAALAYFGLPEPLRHAREYAERKQARLLELVTGGAFVAFPDALRFLLAVRALGIRVAVASSSKNANMLLRAVRLDTFAAAEGLRYPFVAPGSTVLDMVDANVCGRDFPEGKPHPRIFETASYELGVAPQACLVIEDAPVGVQAGKRGGMAAVGVARVNDQAGLAAAGADLVVTTLDEVALDALAQGHLRRVSAAS